MEDDDPGGHHPPAAALAYAWDYQPGAPFDEHAGGDQLDCVGFSTASELRRALVRSLAELDAARVTHQRMESEAARLAALVASTAAERDELRRHCHSLLLLLHRQAPETPAPPPPPPARPDDGGFGSGVGPGGAMDDTELEMALARRLPEKGRLVEAVVSAGPLLQTLLLAGPLPRWCHPPPPAPADIPPFNPGRLSPMKTDASKSNSFSSASAGSLSPESNCSGGTPPPLAQQALPPFHMSSFCM